MQFIYKNITVQIIINIDANKIIAICNGTESSKYKIEKRIDETIKTVDYKQLNTINFTIVEPIDANKEVFSLDSAGDNLSLDKIMEKICKKIDDYWNKNQYFV